MPYRILLVEVDEATRLRRLERRNEGLRHADHRVYLIEGELLERMDAKWQPLGPEETDVELFRNDAELA